MTDKIHYEPHPVTAERKAELRSRGFVIIDIIFRPPGLAKKENNQAVLAKKKPEKSAC